MTCKSEPEREIFAVIWGNVMEELERDPNPNWMDDLSEGSPFDELGTEYGFPAPARDKLVALPRALDRCLAVPADADAPATRRELRKLAHKAASLGADLEEVIGDYDDVRQLSSDDDAPSFEVLPGLWKRFRTISEEIKRLQYTQPPRPGRRRGYLYYAHLALEETINQYRPDMSNAERSALADALFAYLLRCRGHKSRTETEGEPSAPRSSDMVRRVANRTPTKRS